MIKERSISKCFRYFQDKNLKINYAICNHRTEGIRLGLVNSKLISVVFIREVEEQLQLMLGQIII